MRRTTHSHTGPIAVGLDIGTSKIAFCIGTLQDGVPTVIGMSKSPSGGLHKGVITNIEETISALSGAIATAERVSGLQIESAVVGIEGTYITTANSKGVVAVTRAGSEIGPDDIERVIEAARAVALPPNQELLHILPKLYSIDGLEGVKDPLSMTGIRLEVDAYIIGASTAAIRNLTRAVSSAGLHIDGLMFSPLATAQALLTKQQRDNGVLLVDIGAATTSVVVFEEGDVTHATILPIGSSHITNDIAIGLRTTLEVAEQVKQQHAYAVSAEINDSEEIDLSQYDPNEETTPHRKYVCEIVEARLNELFAMLREELRLIERDGMLPAGVVFTGGGSRLAGLTNAAKDTLQLPAQLGTPGEEISGMIDKLDDPVYATSVGLMLHGLTESQQPGRPSLSLGGHEQIVNNVVDKAKGFLKNLLP